MQDITQYIWQISLIFLSHFYFWFISVLINQLAREAQVMLMACTCAQQKPFLTFSWPADNFIWWISHHTNLRKDMIICSLNREYAHSGHIKRRCAWKPWQTFSMESILLSGWQLIHWINLFPIWTTGAWRWTVLNQQKFTLSFLNKAQSISVHHLAQCKRLIFFHNNYCYLASKYSVLCHISD